MKKLFFSLIIGLFGFISFGYCIEVKQNFGIVNNRVNPLSYVFDVPLNELKFKFDDSCSSVYLDVYDSTYVNVLCSFFTKNSTSCNSDYVGKVFLSMPRNALCPFSVFYDRPVLSGGLSNFSGVISGLGSSVNEFIPYVVYIGIGVLLFCVGFVAILWLMRWLYFKVLNIFK